MIDLQPQHLEMVREILRTQELEAEVRIFGSRVNGSARAYSDLDLAVVGEGPLERRTLNRIKEAFAESRLPFRVEVLDWHRLSREFQDIIQHNHRVLTL